MTNDMGEVYSDKETGIKGIRIKGWTIETCHRPISNTKEIDVAVETIGINMPEMIFGNNYLRIKHPNSGFIYEFNAFDSLSKVGKTDGEYERVQVAHSKHWTEKSQKHHGEIKDIVKPFDWTYTTKHPGRISSENYPHDFINSNAEIPVHKLQRTDPILFYDELVLYEDELADNGTALLSIKVRVMPTSFFILHRFFLRVDQVLFRIFDTRIYHEFKTFPCLESDKVFQENLLREYVEKEQDHTKVIEKIPPHKRNDKFQLTDPTLIAGLLRQKFLRIDQIKIAYM